MIERPFTTLSVIGAILSVLTGFLMHIVERSKNDMLLIYDGPWYVAITQLTVGYGEFASTTDVGRFLAIGAGVLGVSTLTLVVTFAFRQLGLNREEKMMIETLYTKQYQQTHLRGLACLYIQRKWRLQKARWTNSPDRLKLIFQMQEVNLLFKKKFGKTLKATPELEDQIRIFNHNVFKVLAEARRRLQFIRQFVSVTDQLSTRQVKITSQLLGFKRAYFRIIMIPVTTRRMFYRANRRHSQRRRNSILSKRESDLAVRKLMERIQERAESVRAPGRLDSEGRRGSTKMFRLPSELETDGKSRRSSVRMEEDAVSSKPSNVE